MRDLQGSAAYDGGAAVNGSSGSSFDEENGATQRQSDPPSARRPRSDGRLILTRSAGPPIAAALLRRLSAGLTELGVDIDRVLRPFGLSGADMASFDEPVRLSTLYDLWQSAVEVTGESGLGVRLASRARPETYELFGCILSNSATLGDALLRAIRFHRLVSNFNQLALNLDGDRATLTIEALYPEFVHRESTEFTLAAVCTLARRIAGRSPASLEVRFTHSAPRDLTHHEQHFQAPVRFNRPHTALVFDSSILHAPVLGGDAKLCEALDRQAQQMLDQLPRPDSLASHVRELIGAELTGGNPSAENIADKLGMHPKTLGRRLKSEGTSHQRLLDELRYQRAERYLRVPDLSINEVAFMLGYADTSALNKAFKRWTGASPTQYRQHVPA